MKKNLTELVFILDRSGSMAGLEKDTIGGFNAMIAQQRDAEGDALVSTVLFSNDSKVIHDRIDVRRVEPLTEREYVACGCTALLDAIGGAIHHIGNVHKYAREEDCPEHTLFVITTDGMENASRHYSSDRVKQMIERQKSRYGWEFLFLGANIDAVETAGHFGMAKPISMSKSWASSTIIESYFLSASIWSISSKQFLLPLALVGSESYCAPKSSRISWL